MAGDGFVLSEGAEESLWEKQVGLGYSTVVVADGRLYTMGYDQEKGLDSVIGESGDRGEPFMHWPGAFTGDPALKFLTFLLKPRDEEKEAVLCFAC